MFSLALCFWKSSGFFEFIALAWERTSKTVEVLWVIAGFVVPLYELAAVRVGTVVVYV